MQLCEPRVPAQGEGETPLPWKPTGVGKGRESPQRRRFEQVTRRREVAGPEAERRQRARSCQEQTKVKDEGQEAAWAAP